MVSLPILGRPPQSGRQRISVTDKGVLSWYNLPRASSKARRMAPCVSWIFDWMEGLLNCMMRIELVMAKFLSSLCRVRIPVRPSVCPGVSVPMGFRAVFPDDFSFPSCGCFPGRRRNASGTVPADLFCSTSYYTGGSLSRVELRVAGKMMGGRPEFPSARKNPARCFCS